MINRCCECSVTVFKACLFDKVYTGLEGGDWDSILLEYIDLSKASTSRRLLLQYNLHDINIRLATVPTLIGVQRTCLKEFGKPLIEGFKEFRRYGHRLVWKEDPEQFEKQMLSAEMLEKRFETEKEEIEQDLQKLSEETSEESGVSRTGFVKMLNELGRAGFRINPETDMEAIALMQSQYTDLQTKANLN